MTLNISELLEEKRKALPVASDYIEELERLIEVSHESRVNLEKMVHQSLTKIQVRNNQFDNLTVKQIELFLGGMEFRSDVQSVRDIALAQRLADECGQPLHRIDLAQEAKQGSSAPTLEKQKVLKALKAFLPWNYHMPGNFELVSELLAYLPTVKLFEKYYQMLKEIDFSLLEDAIKNKDRWEVAMRNELCGECTKTYAYELSKVLTKDDLAAIKRDLEVFSDK
jgi:hypothetical protein